MRPGQTLSPRALNPQTRSAAQQGSRSALSQLCSSSPAGRQHPQVRGLRTRAAGQGRRQSPPQSSCPLGQTQVPLTQSSPALHVPQSPPQPSLPQGLTAAQVRMHGGGGETGGEVLRFLRFLRLAALSRLPSAARDPARAIRPRRRSTPRRDAPLARDREKPSKRGASIRSSSDAANHHGVV
jgi:hypothetical protein